MTRKPTKKAASSALAAVLALSCAAPLAMTVDEGSTSEGQLERWEKAAERITAASGIEIVLAPGKCEALEPACVATVEGYEDQRTLGRGGSVVVLGWASVRRGMDPEAEFHTMTHELLHALGVPHMSSGTLMFPMHNAREQCISNAELGWLCSIRKCAHQKPECSASRWRPIFGDVEGPLEPEGEVVQ